MRKSCFHVLQIIQSNIVVFVNLCHCPGLLGLLDGFLDILDILVRLAFSMHLQCPDNSRVLGLFLQALTFVQWSIFLSFLKTRRCVVIGISCREATVVDFSSLEVRFGDPSCSSFF